MASETKLLEIGSVNPNVVKMEFMVLTPLTLRAQQIEYEIKQVENRFEKI